MPTRRRILAGCGAALTSGCLFMGEGCGVLEMRAEPGPPIDAFRSYAEELTDRRADPVLDEVGAVVETDATLDDTPYAVENGTVYRITRVLDDGRPGYKVGVRLTRLDANSSHRAVHPISRLTDADRRELLALLRSVDLDVHESTTAMLTYEGRDPASFVLASSVTRFQIDEDHRYRVDTDNTFAPDESIYLYRATPIGSTDDDLEGYLDRRFLVTLEDLPPAQRDLLRTGIEDGRDGCIDDYEPVIGLGDRLPEDAALPWDMDRWYVAFEGRRYTLLFHQYTVEP